MLLPPLSLSLGLPPQPLQPAPSWLPLSVLSSAYAAAPEPWLLGAGCVAWPSAEGVATLATSS